MRKNIRTRKNKKYKKHKKQKSSKNFIGGNLFGGNFNGGNLFGGDDNIEPLKKEPVSETDELKKQIEEDHSLNKLLPDFNLGDSQVFKKIVDLSEGLAIKTIDNTSEFLNIDLDEGSEKFQERLEEIKAVLNEPKNKELMREVVANFAEVGIIALDAAKPFIDDLITVIFDKLKIIGSEFGEAGIKIVLNSLTEIPGYGVIIGTIRSVNNMGEAVLASSNAVSEIVTTTSDTINASIQNFDKLLKEKNDVIARTSESINNFSENIKKMPAVASATATSDNTPSTPTASPSPSTGGTKKHKQHNNKSKKVRFNL